MSSPKFSPHLGRSLSLATLLAVAAVLLLCFSASAAALPVATGDGPRTLAEPPTLPVVQVTTDPAADDAPALVRTTDGKLLSVFVRDGDLWSSASTDHGATWSDETQIDGPGGHSPSLVRAANEPPPAPPPVPPPPLYYVSRPSLARTADGTLWLAYGRDGDIWDRSSADDGVTWTAERQLTTDPNSDYDPVVFQAGGGKLWVVWYSYRAGNAGLWYKTSADGGATWSADTRLTTSDAYDYSPAATVAADGRLVVVWSRLGGELWQRSSSDGGDTWSDETQIAGCCRNNPSLATVGAVLWLAYEQDGDIWYRTSTDGGDTWSDEARFTRFLGNDGGATLAALSAGETGVAWRSDRSGNPDIWFGIPGEREDINPPPYVQWIGHWPTCNLDSLTTITFRASAVDETGVASAVLVWYLEGAAQGDLKMYDDGTHGDDAAGDGVWSVEHTPLPPGSRVAYSARATDTDGNTFLSGQNSFQVLAPFVKTADILFVPDYGGSGTAWFQHYYTDTLDALGYKYDTWDAGPRCGPESTILNQYTDGTVIWAAPGGGYITGYSDQRTAVQSYLAAGGKLFITGQNIAEHLRESGGEGFLNNYLHASYVQRDTGLYALAGAAGDPIGDGLVLNISGGDGANDQYSKDEVDPIDPAKVVFTYRAGASAMLAEPIQPEEEPPASAPDAKREPAQPGEERPATAPDVQGQAWPGIYDALFQPEAPVKPAAGAPSAPAGNISSGTAGLRVETDTYKVVYFAFGFEGINNAGRRACVMGGVLGWLNGTPPPLCVLTPENGQAVPAGDVTFTWRTVPGVTSYEIQIDTVPAFDSPDLIDDTVPGTSYNHTFATLGMRYWRVRALPDGGWTATWRFSVVRDVVQVTSDPAEETAPALVQAAGDNLVTVFMRNGGLWSRASTDGGATWAAETQIDGCCRYDPSVARAADGTVWLAYDRYGDIWYRTSTDDGVTWSTERQLTTDPGSDYDPVVFQATDGTLWIVWTSYRAGNADIWYKTSADGSATWSADTRLTTSDAYDYSAAAMTAADGRLVVVWNRYEELWQRSSGDGGDTWSDETQIAGCCRSDPSLAAVDGDLWLAYGQGGDIWYRKSADQGGAWSDETRFTRFMADDRAVTLAALASGKMGFAWQSIRSGNWDIWFGIPGEREDISPPPYVQWIEHRPPCSPDSNATITFRAGAVDETGVARVDLIWALDGKAQPDLEMYDDGTHGDEAAGDGVWSVEHASLPEGSQVTYSARATDTDGNTYLSGENSFQVLAPFVKTADILFVPDYGGWNTSWFRFYFTDALDALGYKYDTWDTDLRCAPESTILNQYTEGDVIWAVPDWSYIVGDSNLRSALQSYLDAGGKLFITGQNIAQYLRPSSGAGFLNDYLHATFKQEDTGLYALAGAAGDPIGDGLALNISGGDGANDQFSKDEVDPIDPAKVVFTYRAGANAMLADPIQPKEEPPATRPDAQREVAPDMPGAPLGPEARVKPTASAPSATTGCIGTCTAGLRVETDTYKVVYFAFGFEAINNAAHRACVMGRVLGWLNDTPPLPCLLTPANGHPVTVGDVSFTWIGVPGATSYEIQIDSLPTFDSPDLVDRTAAGTTYDHTFTAPDTWYWRVRALPDGKWAAPWSFSAVTGVVRVTTNPADDVAPALVQATGDRLLTVFVRDGNLWSSASTDGGATWGAETQIDGCCRYRPSVARATDGTLWLAYERDGDIWYRTSGDNGVTWKVEKRLTTDPNDDHDPVVFEAADGKLWILWWSYRTGYPSLWNRISPDGGATWSAEGELPISEGYNRQPAATVAADGRLVVVWDRWFGQLWQISSKDGGATWSAEKPIGSCSNPSLARAADGTLWLACERDGDIRYRTSTDGGDTWSDEPQFTRFVGGDSSVALAALSSGKMGFAWQSIRGSSPDIWFGIPGQREDINPPPYIELIEHRPGPNPESDDTITFRARATDETGVASVHLVWTLNGEAQQELEMFDDGAHGDDAAGDDVWGVQHPPLPEGSQVSYRARATDTDGNSYRYPSQNFFKVLPPFVKTASILFVADAGGNNTPSDTSWFRPYYTDALDALGYRYDTWDTGLRGEPGSAILNGYTRGAVIWAMPYWGYAASMDGQNSSISSLQAYLDAGGKLFITGQNIAEYIGKVGGEGFLKNYLHATFVQGDTGLYALAGAVGDPIGDGLALNISGGDGANDQYSKDEVDPIDPAEVVFTYRAGASAMLAEPTRPTGEPPDANGKPAPELPGAPQRLDSPATPAAGATSALAACAGSCTAALRVETDSYKVVYFAFGFEAINSAADRSAVMGRVLDWLEVSTVRLYLPLVVAQLPTGDSFWADRYQLGPGECTGLHWSVTNALEVYLNDEPVTGMGTQMVCPAQTTTYVLLVVRESGTQEYRLTIVVDGGDHSLVRH